MVSTFAHFAYNPQPARAVPCRSDGVSFEEKIERIKRGFYLWNEVQTDVNSYVKSFENKEEFIKDYATERVYREFLEHGEEALTKDYSYGFEARFIKPEILSEIDKKVKEIKEYLLGL